MWREDVPDGMIGVANIPFSGSTHLLKLAFWKHVAAGKNLVIILDKRSLENK
jgi:hypothetical protein